MKKFIILAYIALTQTGCAAAAATGAVLAIGMLADPTGIVPTSSLDNDPAIIKSKQSIAEAKKMQDWDAVNPLVESKISAYYKTPEITELSKTYAACYNTCSENVEKLSASNSVITLEAHINQRKCINGCAEAYNKSIDEFDKNHDADLKAAGIKTLSLDERYAKIDKNKSCKKTCGSNINSFTCRSACDKTLGDELTIK